MMKNSIIKSKRDIPSIEILAGDEGIISAGEHLARPLVVEIIRRAVDKIKKELGDKFDKIEYRRLVHIIIGEIDRITVKKIGSVINGTGILVHTNLGRAPLPEELFDRIKGHVTGYGNLEFELLSGKRGKRGELAEKYLAMVSGTEAGAIVNNNAAALFLILNTLANRRKVIISRGELIQIGGGFRIPDIIKKSGARLLEVGTTNITTLEDYRNAFSENPALILKVHRSNFSIAGFTEETQLKALVNLGVEHHIPVINDLGSGVFIDTTQFVGRREPTVQESVRDGADLTCFSGDKLLGGMQAGLIVGDKEMVQRVKRNPVYRALRVDKIVFSTLEELLGHYLDNTWKENIKLWRLAAVSETELYQRGSDLLKEIKAGDKIVLEASQGRMGGGSLPEIPLPSVGLVFRSKVAPQKIASLFRGTRPPVIGRIVDDNFIIDLKAIDEESLKPLIDVIRSVLPEL